MSDLEMQSDNELRGPTIQDYFSRMNPRELENMGPQEEKLEIKQYNEKEDERATLEQYD